ncbi:MAG: GNAT family N-acetyltransferase [Eubacteriales bacterium]|nr:GNAT family N-acetyltransferase [Eubacteriales bacterium]
MHYRRITAQDDAAIARIIRDNLKANRLDIPGTAYFDEGLDHLSDFYASDAEQRAYYVVLDEQNEDTIIGGIGFAKFDGKENCAELQKLYLSDTAKGQGLGYEMIRLVEQSVRKLGYRSLYLETHTNLVAAIHIYEKYGFREIERPAGVVHSTMNRFYELELKE